MGGKDERRTEGGGIERETCRAASLGLSLPESSSLSIRGVEARLVILSSRPEMPLSCENFFGTGKSRLTSSSLSPDGGRRREVGGVM